MAPRWLEVHHALWWDRDDGETSVTNGVAVCSFHHHEIHRRDLAVRRVTLHGDELAAAAPRRVRYVLVDRDGGVVAGEMRPVSPPSSAAGRGAAATGDPRRDAPPGLSPDSGSVAAVSGSAMVPTQPPPSQPPPPPASGPPPSPHDRAAPHDGDGRGATRELTLDVAC